MMKKAQSALEYLMTYGIAIVAIVIVIGLLFAFGFFSPCKLIGSSVSGVRAPHSVSNIKLDTNQNLSFQFKNGLSSDSVGILTLNGTSPSGLTLNLNTNATNSTPNGAGFVTFINASQTALLYMSATKLATGWGLGSCQTVNVLMTYNLSSFSPGQSAQTISATITAPVQAP